MDTPARAPAAESRSRSSAGSMAELRTSVARASPKSILLNASMTWDTPVGTMFMCPWAYPRKAEQQQAHSTEGARASTL